MTNTSSILSNLQFIPSTKDYWFVRTDGGDHFETYIENDYIGIGWNDISLTDLRSNNPTQIKEKIAQSEKIDITISKGKSSVTSIYNKLLKFDALKKGDVVIVPSKSSSRLAFGIVQDEKCYPDITNTKDCEYHKRRKIKWVKVKNINDLDPIFFEIKRNRHSISNIKKYADLIDRVIYTYYVKDDYGNLVLEIKRDEGIKVKDLIGLVEEIHKLMLAINEEFNYNEDIEEDTIKLNLQSPGLITLGSKIGKTLALLGTLIALNSCSSSWGSDVSGKTVVSEDDQKIREIVKKHQQSLSKIQNLSKSLELNQEPIIDTFLIK